MTGCPACGSTPSVPPRRAVSSFASRRDSTSSGECRASTSPGGGAAARCYRDFDVRVRPRLLVAGGSVLACALIAAAFLLRSSSRAEPTTVPPASHAVSSAFPSPPPGATVYARQRGAEALALAVVPTGRQLLLQASVVGQQGQGVSGLSVRFTVAGSTWAAAACGAGCYRATIRVSAR